MSRFSSFVAGVLVAVLLCAVHAVPASALTSEQIVAKTKDSVVRVLVEVKPTDRLARKYYGISDVGQTFRHQAGTGFVVTRNGHIVTSFSVLPPNYDQRNLYVRLPKEGDQEVKQILVDKDRGIACLKIDKYDLTPLSLWTEPLKVGNGVATLGFPDAAVTSQITDKEPSFTEGKVGALKQTYQEMTLVQTDLTVNTGSSGAPLLNSEGNVVGVILGNANRTRTNVSVKRVLEGMFPDEELPVGIAFATPAKLLHDMLIASNIEAIVAAAAPSTPQKEVVKGTDTGATPGNGKDGQTATGKGAGTATTLSGKTIYWILGAVLLLALIVTLLLFVRQKPVEQEKAAELPVPPPPPQPSFSKSTTISLGTLRCTEGELSGRTFSMTDKGLTIGRDQECDIRLSSEIISRRHSWIGPKGGDIAVRDMGSTNGTFLNGKKIEGTATLQKGDVVSLSKSGQETFLYIE